MRKRYGDYREDKCSFCDAVAVHKNGQGVPCCRIHTKQELKVEKCSICGGYADLKNGKFGAYVECMSCGNINLKKYLGMFR